MNAIENTSFFKNDIKCKFAVVFDARGPPWQFCQVFPFQNSLFSLESRGKIKRRAVCV